MNRNEFVSLLMECAEPGIGTDKILATFDAQRDEVVGWRARCEASETESAFIRAAGQREIDILEEEVQRLEAEVKRLRAALAESFIARDQEMAKMREKRRRVMQSLGIEKARSRDLEASLRDARQPWPRITATAGDGVPAEIEFLLYDKVVGFWAYGHWDPKYPYQGQPDFNGEP
jgi:septal ring factor EnvC (AmiA/AmiB activator)